MYHGDIRLGGRLSTIIGLLLTSSPFAVIRTVGAIIINAFNRQFRIRPWPHVGKEVFKRIQPTVANEDSATAVIFPAITLWVCAPSLNVAPDAPFGANAAFPRHSMRSNSFAYQFGSEAPTTDATAISQRSAINGLFSPTIAAAHPKTLVIPTKNRPPSKAPTGHFNKFWHDEKFTIFMGKM